MTSKLREYQEKAVNNLRTGSILCGWVGSGKSITALAYYDKVARQKDLYIITTAAKRDSLDWEREASNFRISKNREHSLNGSRLTVDSWNSIHKYTDVSNGFFIFDEQRVVGSGSWVKSFLKIAKHNDWILLSATPGDTWMDYIPVFVANGFYKNRTEFVREHVVYANRTRFPKIDHYVGVSKLQRHKDSILVTMDYERKRIVKVENIICDFDKERFYKVSRDRWNVFTQEPIKQIPELFYAMRKVVNSDPSRLNAIRNILKKHNKVIVFYNFDYELDLLRSLKKEVTFAEHNGHKHEPIPKSDKWIYAVQYISGAEGWNCTETNVVVFYSLNYSFKIMTQAGGRIDRMNSPFDILNYYYLKSNSTIDVGISKALILKSNFNEKNFFEKKGDSLD